MKNLFIPYEEALALKELGFNEGCFSLYFSNGEFSNFIHSFIVNSEVVEKTNSLPAPTFSQAFKFFREKYGLSSVIHLKMSNNKRKIWFNINELDNRLVKSMYFKSYLKGMFKTYEQAELECLKNLIKIVKENEKVI